MHHLRFQAIAILTIFLCGSAAAYQETPETPASLAPGSQDPNQAGPGKSSASSNEPYFDKLKQDSGPSTISSPALKERLVREANLMIAWSEQLDELRGFSTKVGDWEVLKIPRQKSIVPTLSISVAVVELEGSIAGFSATNCYWDVIELPKGVRAETIVHANMLTVQTPDHLYTFAAEKGQWTSPTDPDLQPVHEAITISNHDRMRDGGIHDQFQKWLESLPKHQARGIQLTGGTALVHVSASRQSLMKAAKQKLSEWGYIGNGSNAQPSPGDLAANLKSKSSKASSLASSPSPEPASTSSVDALRVELEDLETKIVDQLRVGNESQDSKAKLAELRPQAEKAFDLRQQVLRLEAQRLQAKLKSIQESLQAREKNRDDLVLKRLKELGDSPKPKAQANKLDQPAQTIAAPSTTIVQASGSYFEQVTSIAKTLRDLSNSVVRIRANLNREGEEIKALDSQLVALAEKIANGNLGKGTPKAEEQKEALQSNRVIRVESRKYLGQELELEMKKWKQAWKSYNQQVDLLNLEVEKKRNELESLVKVEDATKMQFKDGLSPRSKLAEAERQVKRAEIEVQQAMQIRQLFEQIVADEPELNPDHTEK